MPLPPDSLWAPVYSKEENIINGAPEMRFEGQSAVKSSHRKKTTLEEIYSVTRKSKWILCIDNP